jgi:hypothetical protein
VNFARLEMNDFDTQRLHDALPRKAGAHPLPEVLIFWLKHVHLPDRSAIIAATPDNSAGSSGPV